MPGGRGSWKISGDCVARCRGTVTNGAITGARDHDDGTCSTVAGNGTCRGGSAADEVPTQRLPVNCRGTPNASRIVVPLGTSANSAGSVITRGGGRHPDARAAS